MKSAIPVLGLMLGAAGLALAMAPKKRLAPDLPGVNPSVSWREIHEANDRTILDTYSQMVNDPSAFLYDDMAAIYNELRFRGYIEESDILGATMAGKRDAGA